VPWLSVERLTSLEPDPSDEVGAGAIRRIAENTGLPVKVVEVYGENLTFGDASEMIKWTLLLIHNVFAHVQRLSTACQHLRNLVHLGVHSSIARGNTCTACTMSNIAARTTIR
jgi:hypothetical protein